MYSFDKPQKRLQEWVSSRIASHLLFWIMLIQTCCRTVSTRSMCVGCGCAKLSGTFEGLSKCDDDEEGAFSLRRDLDRLSFLHFEDAFDVDSNGAAIPAISASFKSDSDVGLIFFGYWQNSNAKGRLQVYYHYDSISAIYCKHAEEEECSGCTIRNTRGFGMDQWVQTVLWGGGDEIHLAVDRDVCRLRSASNVSLAEVYAIPQLSQGTGLFVGGTWHEKKRRGLYRMEAEQKFFENTREKAPVLRGCVKDVFSRGVKMDLGNSFETQRFAMLEEPSDSNAFAVRKNCQSCSPTCLEHTRCRSQGPLQSSPMICDCADALQFNSSEGTCERKQGRILISVGSLSFRFQISSQLSCQLPSCLKSKLCLTFRTRRQFWVKFGWSSHFRSRSTKHRRLLSSIRTERHCSLSLWILTELFTCNFTVRKGPHVSHCLAASSFNHTFSGQLDLLDDRVHLLQLQRRTPMGTRHSAKKYDLFVSFFLLDHHRAYLKIDGWHTVVSDIGKLVLNNVSVSAADTQDEWSSVIFHGNSRVANPKFKRLSLQISGFPTSTMSTLQCYTHQTSSIKSTCTLSFFPTKSALQIFPKQESLMIHSGRSQSSLLNPKNLRFWSLRHTEKSSISLPTSSNRSSSVSRPNTFSLWLSLPVSARWILYSLFLTVLLCLLILMCIICYWCVLRRRSMRRTDSGSQRTIMRDSPDYAPVKLRRDSIGGVSMDEDGSIGTDDTDLQAYRDIPSHRVKIYRESVRAECERLLQSNHFQMVSILVPSMDMPAEAAIVKRTHSNASDQLTARPAESHAPLVKVNDDWDPSEFSQFSFLVFALILNYYGPVSRTFSLPDTSLFPLLLLSLSVPTFSFLSPSQPFALLRLSHQIATRFF